MSQDNVENLRAYCAAWEMGTQPDFGLLDPEVVFEDDILPDHADELLVSTHRFRATARHTGIQTELRYAYGQARVRRAGRASGCRPTRPSYPGATQDIVTMRPKVLRGPPLLWKTIHST